MAAFIAQFATQRGSYEATDHNCVCSSPPDTLSTRYRRRVALEGERAEVTMRTESERHRNGSKLLLPNGIPFPARCY